MVRSLEQFRGRRGRQALVLLTDGEDTTSRTDWKLAERYARTMRIPVFPIGLGTGKFGGKKLAGAWAWRDGYWGRTLSTHSKNTDCQLWTINGKQHSVTRERGKGKGFVYLEK